MELSFDATYVDGVLKPAVPLPLADRTHVRVIVQSPESARQNATDETEAIPTLAERLQDFIGCVDGLPEDAALNHDHYLYGAPKQ